MAMQEWRKSSVLAKAQPREPVTPHRSVAGNKRFTIALPMFDHHTISLERWSIKYGLRERRTALADWDSASYHYSASVVLALDPAPRPDAGQTKNAARLKSCLLAEASPSLPPACYIKGEELASRARRHLTSMTFASPCLLNKLRVTSRPCRWSLRSRRDLPRLNWFKVT